MLFIFCYSVASTKITVNAEIISNEDLHKVASGSDEVVCFMGCAHIDDLIEAYKNINM